jgi:hypothetical protein
MRFQVPQFIETEDKIVGPFSLREFMYIGTAGGTCLLLYFIVYPEFWIAVAPFLFGAGLALAFIKVNGRTLPEVLRNAFLFYWKPQTYIWNPEGAIDKKTHLESVKKKKIMLEEQHAPVTKFEHTTKEREGFSLENIMSGFALKNKWHNLQTGTRPQKVSPQGYEERYEIFQRLSGDQRAARRIDYT